MADVTFTVPNKNGSYDGDMVVKNYTSLTINAGDTVTVDQPCRGLLLMVKGDVVINGTLTMQTRGPAANPATAGGSDNSATNTLGLLIPYIKSGGVALSGVSAALQGCGTEAVALNSKFATNGTGYVLRVPRLGAGGGAGGSAGISGSYDGAAGGAGSITTSNEYRVLQFAGGGAGGKYSDPNSCSQSAAGSSGNGGAGTCWTGGTSGGGKMSGTVPTNSSASNGNNYGGIGGNAGNGHCGGTHGTSSGLGNPNGYWMYNNATNTGDVNRREQPSWGTQTSSTLGGQGGLIIIIAGGNVTVGSGGSINANGANNNYSITLPSGNAGNYGGMYGGGGATAGGAITILHKGTYTNNGSVTCTGGTVSSANAAPGGAGGAGPVFVEQIA
jgi:hypothetical protein